jgi:hypothetical protein
MYKTITLQFCSLFDIRSIFNSRQSADKQVDVTGVSTVLFTDSFPHILRLLQRSSLPIQPSFRPNAAWCISYQSLSCSWHTWPGNMAHGECDRSTGDAYPLNTPPRHLIPPLVYPEVRACSILKFVYFLQNLF